MHVSAQTIFKCREVQHRGQADKAAQCGAGKKDTQKKRQSKECLEDSFFEQRHELKLIDELLFSKFDEHSVHWLSLVSPLNLCQCVCLIVLVSYFPQDIEKLKEKHTQH